MTMVVLGDHFHVIPHHKDLQHGLIPILGDTVA